jgi:hypothetical protein
LGRWPIVARRISLERGLAWKRSLSVAIDAVSFMVELSHHRLNRHRRLGLGKWGGVLALVAGFGLVTASGASAQNAKGEEQLAKMLEGREMLAAVPCIEVRKIITTEIINSTAIVYRLRGSPTLYVNKPTAGLNDLNANNSLTVDSDAVKLCEGNNLFAGDNGGRGAAAGYTGGIRLGEFVPYKKP